MERSALFGGKDTVWQAFCMNGMPLAGPDARGGTKSRYCRSAWSEAYLRRLGDRQGPLAFPKRARSKVLDPAAGASSVLFQFLSPSVHPSKRSPVAAARFGVCAYPATRAHFAVVRRARIARREKSGKLGKPRASPRTLTRLEQDNHEQPRTDALRFWVKAHHRRAPWRSG